MPMVMRIAYVCGDRGVSLGGRGGSATHVREFIAALCRRGVGVTAFAAGATGERGSRPFPCPVVDLAVDPLLHELRTRIAKSVRAGSRSAPRAAEVYSLLLNQTLADELMRRRGAIDLVYERSSLWSFAGLQFARRARVPFILEVNAPLAAQQKEYRALDLAETAHAIEATVLSGADCVVVTSPALKEYAHGRGATRKKVRVIPCGVTAEMLSTPRRPRNEDAFVIGFVGTLKPWHGIELLAEAFSQLCLLHPSYRLLVVGDGPLLPQLERLRRRLHIGDRVSLVGSVDHADVPAYLSQIDVGLAPYPPLSSFYFSPLKVWEYAAAGVPIVASASGELPRLFPHRVAALLHPAGNVGKIVRHVERLRQDPELANRLARRARQVAKRHTWDRLAARFEAIAARALVSRRGIPGT